MLIFKTHDKTLHGLKYCVQDRNGNLIAVLPTRESANRELAFMGIKSDSIVEVLFTR